MPAGRSAGIKFLLIVALTVAMAVPLFFIQLALSDRERTADTAVQDVSSGWGGAQATAGPILFVPYVVTVDSIIDGKTVQTPQYLTAVLLPNTLNVKVWATTGERWRGIFKVPVFKAAIDMRATFDKRALADLIPKDAAVSWERATVSILVSDAHGLADNVSLSLNGRSVPFQPGIGRAGPTGIHAPLGLATIPGDLTLQTQFVLRGSREFSIAPLGKRTTAAFESSWGSPSFFGAFLPTDRTVSDRGFTASWTVPYLARGFEQSFGTPEEALQSIVSQNFGVRFYQPVDYYQLVERSLKYAILFVALAFLIFFVIETISGRRLHAVQYTMVGAAQVLFYLLLLSLAEHIGFAQSYMIAAGGTVTLTGSYAISAFASKARALLLTAILSSLYGLLYVILNAEDYALLIGSGVLFAALAATMYATRRIDWHRLSSVPV
jgi:inner membrane protein